MNIDERKYYHLNKQPLTKTKCIMDQQNIREIIITNNIIIIIIGQINSPQPPPLEQNRPEQVSYFKTIMDDKSQVCAGSHMLNQRSSDLKLFLAMFTFVNLLWFLTCLHIRNRDVLPTDSLCFPSVTSIKRHLNSQYPKIVLVIGQDDFPIRAVLLE